MDLPLGGKPRSRVGLSGPRLTSQREAQCVSVEDQVNMKTLLRLEPFRLKNDGYAIMYPKNPVRFNFYKYSCGRARRLAELWGHSP